jgi:hypothetical protein
LFALGCAVDDQRAPTRTRRIASLSGCICHALILQNSVLTSLYCWIRTAGTANPSGLPLLFCLPCRRLHAAAQ